MKVMLQNSFQTIFLFSLELSFKTMLWPNFSFKLKLIEQISFKPS